MGQNREFSKSVHRCYYIITTFRISDMNFKIVVVAVAIAPEA